MEDRCVVCNDIIPEGTQVCPNCQNQIMKGDADESNKSSKSSI